MGAAAREALGARRLDLAFTGLALVVLLPTLWYRYGLDQSLYQYIGAGWMRGRLPYLKAFDVKPPGIYLIYGVSGLLSRNAEAAIRCAEALCIVGTGWSVTAIVPRDRRPDGLAGVAALLLSAWNAVLFGFWDTGQVELWEACCLVLAFVAIARGPVSGRTLFAAGAWLSGAVLFKLTAVLAAVPLLAMVLAITRKASVGARVRAVASFAAGSVTPVAVVGVYFAAFGGGRALAEWLLYLPHYARAPLDAEWVRKIGPEMLLARCGTWFGLLSVPILGGLRAELDGGEESERRTASWATGLLLAGVLSIVVQRRYFSYHPVVLGPLLVLAATPGLSLWLRKDRALTGLGTGAVVVGTFFSGPTWTGNEFTTYRSYVLDAWIPFIRGRKPREDFVRSFGGPFQYTYQANEAVAGLIDGQAPTRTDRLHVRGYDTTIYTLTGLFSPSRFFMEAPLGGYFVTYRPEWADEHERALRGASAPRFFVTQTSADGDIRALLSDGYGLLGSRDRYVVLERGLRSDRLGSHEASEFLGGRRLSGVLVTTISFDLSFALDGTFTGSIHSNSADGTWKVQDDGQVCATLGPKRGCARLYQTPAFVLAFDDEWRELAKIPRSADSR